MRQGTITLEEYQIQRKYRQEKRKQYLKKFQLLKLKMGLSSASQLPHHPIPQHHTSSVSQPKQKLNNFPENAQADQIAQLQKEQEQLKNQLIEQQQKQRNNLLAFKQKIAQVKSKYIEQITTINNEAKSRQAGSLAKIQKLNQQIKAAEEKNIQIEEFNNKIQTELNESTAMMQKYSTEIKNEYSKKLEEFEKIFESSSEKIQAMENQFNDEEFVESTINNEELINSFRQNSEKAVNEIDNILTDYKQLLKGKTEILKELTVNNEMKQKEISKMGELQGKLKVVFEKLNEEKKIYVSENTRMAEELMEVKKLLMGNLPQTQ